MKRSALLVAFVLLAATACTQAGAQSTTTTTVSTAPAQSLREIWIDTGVMSNFGIDSAYYPPGATIEIRGVRIGGASACIEVGPLVPTGGDIEGDPALSTASRVCANAPQGGDIVLNSVPVPLQPGVRHYGIAVVSCAPASCGFVWHRGYALIRW